MDSAARRLLDCLMTRVAPAPGVDSVCRWRWTHSRMGLSTRTTDGMIGNDGPAVFSAVPVSVTETSVVITAAAVNTD